MKPGWKSTEFWTATIAQGLTLLAVLGVIGSNDRDVLNDALAKMIGAVAALIVNGAIVLQYIKGRVTLKARAATGPVDATSPAPLVNPRAILLPLLGAYLLATPVQAQSLLPWRNQIDQRLRDQQSQINQLIANQRQAPQPPAPIIINPQPLPIQGEPKQALPVPGEPKQQLPPGGHPKQELPPGGDPRQPLPIMPPAPPGARQAVPYSVRYRALNQPIP